MHGGLPPTSNGTVRCRHLHDGWVERSASCAEWGRPLATRLCGVPRDSEGTPGVAPVQRWPALRFVTCLRTAPAADFAVGAMRYRRLAQRVNKTVLRQHERHLHKRGDRGPSHSAGMLILECGKCHHLTT